MGPWVSPIAEGGLAESRLSLDSARAEPTLLLRTFFIALVMLCALLGYFDFHESGVRVIQCM